MLVDVGKIIVNKSHCALLANLLGCLLLCLQVTGDLNHQSIPFVDMFFFAEPHGGKKQRSIVP